MTGLDVVAQLADTSLTYIREINPQYLRLATPPGTTSIVRVPAGRQASTQAAYAALPAAERVTFAYYTAKKGDTPRVARAALRRARGRPLRGQSLDALRQRHQVGTSGRRAHRWQRQRRRGPAGLHRARARGRRSRGGYHTVRKGETLGGIAKRYRMSTAQLRSMNNLSGNTIRVGQKLRVSGGASRSTTQVASRRSRQGGGAATSTGPP